MNWNHFTVKGRIGENALPYDLVLFRETLKQLIHETDDYLLHSKVIDMLMYIRMYELNECTIFCLKYHSKKYQEFLMDYLAKSIDRRKGKS